MDEIKKKDDEGWKEAVEKEKEALKRENKFLPPEPDFNFFITTLSLQASIALGVVPNPATNKTEEDLTQARFLIDTLAMLKEKTKGNLTPEETNLLENLLYELRMQYIAKQKES
jgi:coproporphyrinogen III oxidase-like Fe-S oxidoreductase